LVGRRGGSQPTEEGQKENWSRRRSNKAKRYDLNHESLTATADSVNRAEGVVEVWLQ
jgi:hypothetical protein